MFKMGYLKSIKFKSSHLHGINSSIHATLFLTMYYTRYYVATLALARDQGKGGCKVAGL